MDEVEFHAAAALSRHASPNGLASLKQLQNSYWVISQVMKSVNTAWPVYLTNKNDILLCSYYENRMNLSMMDGLMACDDRISALFAGLRAT